MSFFTIGWQAPANVGWLPQHPGDGTDPFFTLGWAPKQSATYYPFSADGLLVVPGQPDAPLPSPGHEAPGSPAPSPVLRAHVARAYVAKRKSPARFRGHGLAVLVELQAPATITAVLVASAGRRRLTYEQTRKLPAGTTQLRLHPSGYGKLATRHHKRVATRLELAIAYADGSKGSLARSVVLEAAPVSTR